MQNDATPAPPLPMTGTINSRIGPLAFEGGYPIEESLARLYDELDFQRAVQTYLWAIPLVSFAQWQEQHEQVFGAGDGDLQPDGDDDAGEKRLLVLHVEPHRRRALVVVPAGADEDDDVTGRLDGGGHRRRAHDLAPGPWSGKQDDDAEDEGDTEDERPPGAEDPRCRAQQAHGSELDAYG